MSEFTSPGEEKLGDAMNETFPETSTLNRLASSPDNEYVRVSPSTSEPVRVSNTAPAATLSKTSIAFTEPIVGASLTALTISEIVALLAIVLSTILKTRSPIVVFSLFTFSFGLKVIPARSVNDRVEPTLKTVPDASVSVPPDGIESTVIVNESEISPDEAIEKEPAVSSEKLKLWLDNENEDVGVGAAGAELPPPPPPPQEAKVSAVRLAKSKDDFPLS